ncbi:MAG: retroviral-like aspartic protease family protein [bacterium]
MGRVTAKIKVENMVDYLLSKRGEMPSEQARFLEVDEALVDTGATLLCLRHEQITRLGLAPLEIRKAQTASGPVERQVYTGAMLTIMGRTCSTDVMEIPEDAPVLIGYLALEGLDLQPDPKSQKVIPNPAHGGKFIMDLY